MVLQVDFPVGLAFDAAFHIEDRIKVNRESQTYMYQLKMGQGTDPEYIAKMNQKSNSMDGRSLWVGVVHTCFSICLVMV